MEAEKIIQKAGHERISSGSSVRRDRMANERTFLAWIRTSLAIMAFGFVVERFALFIHQLFSLRGKLDLSLPPAPGREYVSVFGILLIGVGTLMGMLAFFRFRRVERQIDRDVYYPSYVLDFFLTLILLSIGVFLVVYLVRNL